LYSDEIARVKAFLATRVINTEHRPYLENNYDKTLLSLIPPKPPMTELQGGIKDKTIEMLGEAKNYIPNDDPRMAFKNVAAKTPVGATPSSREEQDNLKPKGEEVSLLTKDRMFPNIQTCMTVGNAYSGCTLKATRAYGD